MGVFLSGILIKYESTAVVLVSSFSECIGKIYNRKYAIELSEEVWNFEPDAFNGTKLNLLVSPVGEGWVSLLFDMVYDPLTLAGELAVMLKNTMMYVEVNDSDQWRYILFNNGNKIDYYLSNPEITDEPPTDGDPKKVAALFNVAEKEKELVEVLKTDYTFAEDGLYQFLQLIGFEPDVIFGTQSEEAEMFVLTVI